MFSAFPDYHLQTMDFIEKNIPKMPILFKTVIDKCWEKIDFTKVKKYEDFQRVEAKKLVELFSHPGSTEFSFSNLNYFFKTR